MLDQNALDRLDREMEDLNNRLSVIEHSHGYVRTAFPHNDLGKPDFDGHRKSHLQQMADAKVVDGFKQDAAKKVMGIVITVVLTLLATGFFTTIGDRLK